MHDQFQYRLIGHMSDPRYRPQQVTDLARELGIPDDQLEDFRLAAQQLLDAGQAVLSSSNAITLPPPGREVVGAFRLNAKGFGFVVPDSPIEHGDLFVNINDTNGAMTGDRVRAAVIRQPHRAKRGKSPYLGRVVEILQRAEQTYVGTLVKRGSQWIVKPDGKALTEPVIIHDPHAKNARPGDKVAIELLEYPDGQYLPEGVITEVIGEAGEPDTETLAVMKVFGLAEKFSDGIMAEARAAAKRFDPKAVPGDRVDLTDVFTVTIDPPDAKDFDDAISIKSLDPAAEGGAAYELGIHIADVAHFIEPGSAMDNEAKKRGNSTYLPRKVIPMLPELLSNGVCSLQEGVNRYTKSAIIRYDAKGNVLSQRLCRSVICSNKRLTYLEAQALIDGDKKLAKTHAKTDGRYTNKLTKTVQLMDELARVIRKRRLKVGMIVLDLPDVELLFDDTGRVVDAQPEDSAFTHTVIEMFMVEANEAVARLFYDLDIPMIRRIHPDPPHHDLKDLRRFTRVAGFDIPANPTPSQLQGLLDHVRGKPAQFAVHLAVLKTLSQAEYAPLLIGHFALASEHYAHFTSPIRRYPDLIVHRALDAYFDAWPSHMDKRIPSGKKQSHLSKHLHSDSRCPTLDHLREMGSHCSATSRNSEIAERELRYYFVLDLLARHIGDEYEGIVNGITGSGLYIQLTHFLVDGFIPLSDLPTTKYDQRWRLNRTTGSLTEQRTGQTIVIGDRFKVRIINAQPEKRKLELYIVEPLGNKKFKQSKSADKPSRTKVKKKPKLVVKSSGKGKGKSKGKPKRKSPGKKKRG